MKIKKPTAEKATKQTRGKIMLKLSKLIMFIALIYTAGMKAQSPPYVAPYPATSLGQSLLITTTDPAYSEMMSAAANARTETINYLENCGSNCQPNQYIYCNATVCCDANRYYEAGCNCYVWYINCWMNNDAKTPLCVIIQ